MVCYGRASRRCIPTGKVAILQDLFYEPFLTYNPYDENRANDGIALRYRFQNEMGYALDRDEYSKLCSVLEMLVALSERMAFFIFDPVESDGPSVPECFWEIIKNLDLTRSASRNKRIIQNLINRNYMPDGSGGLFPLRNPREDQRTVEIWYQLMAYLNEK